MYRAHAVGLYIEGKVLQYAMVVCTLHRLSSIVCVWDNRVEVAYIGRRHSKASTIARSYRFVLHPFACLCLGCNIMIPFMPLKRSRRKPSYHLTCFMDLTKPACRRRPVPIIVGPTNYVGGAEYAMLLSVCLSVCLSVTTRKMAICGRKGRPNFPRFSGIVHS